VRLLKLSGQEKEASAAVGRRLQPTPLISDPNVR